ncbi:MAG: hypothetical protein IJQ33_12335 [Clostridia bacterium]|nr:hypothetical protein [Clostridia bacterium]
MSEGALQDRYLDVLLEMVFEEQEEKAVERLAQSPDPELTEEQRTQADRMLEKALQKNDQWEKEQKRIRRKERKKRLRKGLLLTVVLALGLSSVGLATITEFREAIMRMFVRVNVQTNSVWMYSDEETARRMEAEFMDMQPPDGWAGHYFFSSIPEGFTLDTDSVTERSVCYKNGNQAFTFAEHFNHSDNERSLTGLDYTEGLEKEWALNYGGFVSWEDKQVLAWDDVFSWFELIGENMTRDELLSLAGRVLPLAHEMRYRADLGREADAAASSYWGGDWFPAFLPNGLHVISFSRGWDGSRMTLSDSFGMKISLMETGTEGSAYAAQMDDAVISTVSLNGGEATLVDGYSGGGNTAEILWQAGEKTLRVQTVGYSSAGTLRVAESMRRLTEEEKRESSFWISDGQAMNAIQPPEIWQGAYFPAFLPDGFQLTDYDFINQDRESVMFRTADYEEVITLRRCKDRPDLNYYGPGSVQIIPFGDRDALMVQTDEGGRSIVQVTLQCGEQWYMIRGDGISAEELIKIAQSMKENQRLIAKNPINRYQADFEKTETPAGWAGRCFPSLLPGDLTLDESNTDQDSVAWQGKDGRRMTLRYSPSCHEVRFGEQDVAGTMLTVNGCSACMLEETLFSVSKACLFWQDQSGFYELDFSGFPTDEALAVARGIVAI